MPVFPHAACPMPCRMRNAASPMPNAALPLFVARALCRSVLKYLNAPIVRIRDKDAIFAVDPDSRRKRELRDPATAPPEVVEQRTLAIEHLDRYQRCIHEIHIAFTINAQPLRPEERSGPIAQLAKLRFIVPVLVEYLHAEVHRIYHIQFIALQEHFGREVKFRFSITAIAEVLLDVAIHIGDVHAVAQRIGHVDTLRRFVYGDARRTLIKAFTLDVAQHATALPPGVENKYLAQLRIGDVDVVFAIHRHPDRRLEGISLPAFDRRVLALLEVEDVYH